MAWVIIWLLRRDSILYSLEKCWIQAMSTNFPLNLIFIVKMTGTEGKVLIFLARKLENCARKCYLDWKGRFFSVHPKGHLMNQSSWRGAWTKSKRAKCITSTKSRNNCLVELPKGLKGLEKIPWHVCTHLLSGYPSRRNAKRSSTTVLETGYFLTTPHFRRGPCGLMDKALASGAKDCGFESHQGREKYVFNLGQALDPDLDLWPASPKSATVTLFDSQSKQPAAWVRKDINFLQGIYWWYRVSIFFFPKKKKKKKKKIQMIGLLLVLIGLSRGVVVY